MVELSIKDNIKEVTRYLKDVQRRQVPFATSRAMNDAAIEAQKAQQAAIPTLFNNRKKWWLKQQPTGIKVKFSNKADLHAAVYSDAYFAEIQEEGGVKVPRSNRVFAIPADSTPKKYRRSGGAREYKQEKPRSFSLDSGIFIRRSKKRIELVFTYAKQAVVHKRFGFVNRAKTVVTGGFAKHFETRMAQALATARKPGPPR